MISLLHKYKLEWVCIFLCLFFSLSASANENRLRLAITTTTENSGLINRITPVFESKYGVEVDTIVVGSGQAISLGENGDVDALLVHAEDEEIRFVNSGYGLSRTFVMYNEFVLLGPQDDPLSISKAGSVPEAFQLLNEGKAKFISRGDESGTHKREKKLWELASVDNFSSNYQTSGQGMGPTLLLANELQAYVLSDMGTYLAMRDKLSLKVIYSNDALFYNPYHIIPVTPLLHENIQSELADKFIKFITSVQGQRIINDYQLDGEQLFYPIGGVTRTNPQAVVMKEKRGFFTEAASKAANLIINFDQKLFSVVWNSLRISLISVVIASIIAIPLGLIVALKIFPGRQLLLSILNTLMALPTVVVGLLLYALLNRQGALGGFGLLYTPTAMVIGQSILIIPIIWNLSIAAVNSADSRLQDTCLLLGANLFQQGLIYVNEVRFALMAAVVAGFGRAIGEVGVAMMLGGNIDGFTRTMTTAIALETSKGDFEFALALGCMLLLVAFIVNILLQQFQGFKR